MKFESSSAGLVVFLIGAAFLAMPLLIPERAAAPAAVRSDPRPAEDAPARATAVSGDAAAAEGDDTARSLMLPAAPNVDGQEPNDTLRTANQLPLGTVVSGTIDGGEGEPDWFVIPVDGAARAEVEVKISRPVGDSSIISRVYNTREERVGFERHGSTGAEDYIYAVDGTDSLYVEVYSGGSYRGPYELVATPVER